MRIAIDGAQSTGKTTLYCQLKETHLQERYSFIPEASRYVAPTFGVLKSTDWAFLFNNKVRLRAFFEAEESWQLNQKQGKASWIIDSSIYLIAAYRTFFGIDPDISMLQAKSYDLILYCPVDSCALLENGFRFKVGRKDIDGIYRRIAAYYHCGKFVILPSGPDRLAAALAAIDSLEIQK